MNVVPRVNHVNVRDKPKFTKDLVRKDVSFGVCGFNSVLPRKSFAGAKFSSVSNMAPRYQFLKNDVSVDSRQSMGPPTGPPRGFKRKIIQSTSSKPETLSSGQPRPKILASDSAVNTSNDFSTPKNRPSALRYISSSSRGHTGNRSALSTSVSAVEPSVILAISEGRGMARGEIGIAAVDLRHPHLVLCQFSDTLLYTHTLTKINYFNPIEIIVPHTFCEGVKPNQLYQLIKDQYPLINLTTVQRRHFNDAAGRQHIQTLCAPQYSAVYLQVMHKFYAVTAAAAVLKYVEYIQCIVFARESLKVEYHSSENTMVIDIGTATQLELVQPLVPSAGPTCSLLGVLGPTYTVGGIRALRAAILQPSCNKQSVESRLDAVQDLIENDDGLMVDLQDVIKKLSEIDKILLLCMETSNQNMDKIGEAQMNQTLLLKTTMDMVPKLVDALNNAVSGRLLKIKMDLENPNYNEIAERIKIVIQDDAHLEKGAMGSLQRCFAVRPEINGLLDVARRTYSELIEDIQKIVEQLSETFDLPLRLNQNVMKGFHIVMPIAPKNRRSFNIEELPPIFIQVHNNGASVSMSTEDLVVLDQQAKESLSEIQKMSNIVISSLLAELRPFMASLYTLCEDVAELDVLLAMAQASSIGSYIRPEFNTYMDIRNSVHPLLDYNSQVMPVPNDIFASPEHNFNIITGPNMGGKSIYIKQIAIMQIMGQLGCFVPATNAVLRLCDRIFSRIGFNDSVELNASTYVFEMKETQHILKGLTSSSLVVIDELCRATCEEEGTSIAWAICEELISSNAFTFFTTHFLYLTRLQEIYFSVVNYHTAVTEEDSDGSKRLIYQHKIEPGVTKIEQYGLALAAKTNLPEDTVKLAKELAELISQNMKVQEIRTPQNSEDEALYKISAKLKQASRKNIDAGDIIKQTLQQFKRDHPEIIDRIKTNRSNSANDTDCSANPSEQNTKEGNEKIQTFTVDSSSNINSYQNLSTTNVDQDSSNLVNGNAFINCASVKSSEQLLNSVLNDNQHDGENDSDIEMRDDFSGANVNDQSFGQSKVNIIISNDFNNVENINNSQREAPTDEVIDMNESTTDSDLAEALTQIVEEFSSRNENSSDQNSDLMSVDEELVEETVKEINEDLLNGVNTIDSIVLTPPADFRDI